MAFVQRLRELGFVDGRNLLIEYRSAGGRVERLPGLAVELARQQCDIFLAPGPGATLVALKQATGDAPIIMVANDYDPVATGHVAGLAQPGGRITGDYQLQDELSAKRLELLKELLPARPQDRRAGRYGHQGTTGRSAGRGEEAWSRPRGA
ncbi:MAG: hypothetical protein IPI73_11140 [Betaproteobacteria bacterium]|nr:hypothetical protein [Betaproteobacteria bacterium]